MRDKVLKARVTAWNQAVAIGHPVLLIDDTGQIVDTRTRGDAYVLGGHSALVMVEGITGGYALERVIPVVSYEAAEDPEPDMSTATCKSCGELVGADPHDCPGIGRREA